MSDRTVNEWRFRGVRFSEGEMRKTQCPNQLAGPRREGLCIGPSCAAWRSGQVMVSAPHESDDEEGYEGQTVTVDIPHRSPIFWCGLAPKPE